MTAVGPLEDLVGVLPVLLEGFALVGEHGDAGGRDGGGGVVLRGENIARGPADLGPERLQRLDEHGGLDGHVQRAGDAGTLQGLLGRVLVADCHQAGHLGFSDGDLAAAPGGQADIGYMIVFEGRSLGGNSGHVHSLLKR